LMLRPTETLSPEDLVLFVRSVCPKRKIERTNAGRKQVIFFIIRTGYRFIV
jgi:hypothetical protein